MSEEDDKIIEGVEDKSVEEGIFFYSKSGKVFYDIEGKRPIVCEIHTDHQKRVNRSGGFQMFCSECEREKGASKWT
jgi:hypothetical protein